MKLGKLKEIRVRVLFDLEMKMVFGLKRLEMNVLGFC